MRSTSSSSGSSSSAISTLVIQNLVEEMKNKQHRSSTQSNYLKIWRCFNEFIIRLDLKPRFWEDRLILFVGYLIQTKKKSNTIRSYISAIKAVLFQGGIWINEDRYLLRALTRRCKLTNDKVHVRLPIYKDMLVVLLKEIRDRFATQPYISALYLSLLLHIMGCLE